MYTVYGHRFPNGKLYIGITKRKLEYRFGKNGENYKRCTLMYRAIQKYGWDNIEHYTIISCDTKEDAEWYERFLIYKYNTTDPQFGYNIMPGGDARGDLPEESRKRIGEKNKLRWANDTAKRQAASERMRKRMSDPAYREKVLNAINRVRHGCPSGVKRNGKKVVQMSEDRTVIKVWDSMADVQRAGIATRQAISLCCINGTNKCKGYLWEYYSEYSAKLDTEETV